MSIAGVEIHEGESCTLYRVASLTDELKGSVRNELAAICYGDYMSSVRGVTYQRTIAEFVERYSAIVKNRPQMRAGVLGELLGHVLIRSLRKDLRSGSTILNKEEYQIKKGFDANFLKDNEYWFGEVKSGEVLEGDVNDKNISLLYKAKADVQDKILDYNRAPLWDSAMIDAALTFEPERHKTVSSQIQNNREVAKRVSSTKLNNIVLITVPFGDVATKALDIAKVEAYAKAQLVNFSKCIAITIQKSTIEKLEGFLAEEASAYVS